MLYTSLAANILPPQMIPLKEKDEKWKKENMDVLENIGRSQLANKGKLEENYMMIKGKFIFKQYIEEEDYENLIGMLSSEFKIPTRLKHYDIISQVVNTLLGEMMKRPDIFTVKCMDEQSKNRFIAEKSRLLHKYVNSKIENWIELALAEEGLTLDGQEFESEEEQQAFIQQIENRRSELTPKEIENFMATQFTEQAEIWANAVLTLDEQRFKLNDLKAIEFLDMLATDQCYRHFYLTPTGYNQETWNPREVFSDIDGDNQETEKSSFVGRQFYATYSNIIDRYGYKMTEDQIKKLDNYRKGNYDGSNSSDPEYYNPGGLIPYLNYPEHKQITQFLGRDPLAPMDSSRAVIIDEHTTDNPNKCLVTEAYWMSQMRIGKFCYIDGETGQKVEVIVDETFDKKLFPDVKEYKGTFNDGYKQKPNTIVWTYVNQVYKGIKINPLFGNNEEIYLDIGPNEFQANSESHLYGNKIPVVGGYFNARNGGSCSLIDLMKPHQIGYNIAINQGVEILQKEKGRFMLMDANMIPNDKDWGGPRNYERFMMIAKELGIAPVDASPANSKNSSFSHFQVIDLDESARILNRFKIAEIFETFALKQVGITPQRLGSVMASETATGVQQAVNQSYAQTETYFTRFYSYLKRCMQMNLDIAQFCAVRERDITLSYITSDMSKEVIKIQGDELLGKMFGLYVVDSQEVVRQLETIRSLMLNNPNSGAELDDLATAILSNSVAEIKTQLKTSVARKYKNIEEQRAHESDMNQQQIQAQQEMEQIRIAKEDERLDKNLANQRYIAEIKALGFAKNNDMNENDIHDALEIQKFNQQINKDSEDILFRQQQEGNRQMNESSKILQSEKKLALEQEKLSNERSKQKLDHDLKLKELKVKEKDIEAKKFIAVKNKNKYDKK